MSKYSRRDFLKLAGVSAVAVSGSAMAAGENPFEFKDLEGGYQQVATAQGNCGAQMKNSGGSCGAQMKNSGGSCGAQMKNSGGSCGAQMKNSGGSCGASMQKQEKKPSQEGKCGNKM